MDQAQKSLNGKISPTPATPRKTRWPRCARAPTRSPSRCRAANTGQDNGQEDPLGRGPTGPGSGVKLPDANALARARDILQELRRRAGERGRPPQELDYIDRLLREF